MVAHEAEIIVNGKRHKVVALHLGYNDIVRLADMKPNRKPTITFKHLSGATGSVKPGQTAFAGSGTIFNVAYTEGA